MFAKLLAAASVSAALLLASSVARADETTESEKPRSATEPKSETPTKPQPKTESHWYGYQMLATDALAIATVAISASADNTTVQTTGGVAGLATYAVAPVVIHAVHGHGGKAAADAAIRILTPVLGAGIGALVGMAMWEPPQNAGLATPIVAPVTLAIAMYEGMAIGGLIGAGTAITIDAAALAHEQVPVGQNLRDERPRAQAKKPAPSVATIRPTAAPTRDGFMAGVGGTF